MLRVMPAWFSGYARIIILVTVLVNLATQLSRNAYGLTLPSMRDSLDLSYSQAGGLVAAASILGMLAALIFGMMAPRYGSRLIVGASTITGGVAMVFLGASPSFTFALAMAAIIGFSVQGAITPAMGLLSVWFRSGHRGAVAGLAAGGGGASFILLGALVPWLTGRDPEDGWRHTWYVLGGLTVAIGVISLLFLRDRPSGTPEESKTPRAWPLTAYKNRLVWIMTFLAVCSGWSVSSYTTFFGVYLEEQGVSLATSGRLMGLLGLLAIGSGVLWGAVSDRLGRATGFLFSFLTFGIGCLLFWEAPVMAGFIASVVLVGLTFRATYTIAAAASGDYVPPSISAAAFGLTGVGASLGQATGPLVGGRIADATGELGWIFVLTAGVLAVAVVGSGFLRGQAISSAD